MSSVLPQPGSVVVMVMQPGWCSQHWTYSGQAVRAGMYVVVLCHATAATAPNATHVPVRWASRGWLRGHWVTQNLDFVVDMPALTQALALAGHAYLTGGGSTTLLRDAPIDRTPRVVAVVESRMRHFMRPMGPINTTCGLSSAGTQVQAGPWVHLHSTSQRQGHSAPVTVGRKLGLALEVLMPTEWLGGSAGGLYRGTHGDLDRVVRDMRVCLQGLVVGPQESA